MCQNCATSQYHVLSTRLALYMQNDFSSNIILMLLIKHAGPSFTVEKWDFVLEYSREIEQMEHICDYIVYIMHYLSIYLSNSIYLPSCMISDCTNSHSHQ
jgi:hypothetical protein